MPLLETKGAASAQGFGLTLSSGPVNYIEDVFSTYLYTGNGSTQTITNGIDLSTKGGLVWVKTRTSATNHVLVDSARSLSSYLASNLTNGSISPGWPAFVFNANGFSIPFTGYTEANATGQTYASWTFRKQPKFFDVVTFTGNGSLQTISHSLNSLPGCLIYKRINSTSDWYVVTRKSATEYVGLKLNTTGSLNFTGTPAALGLTSTTFDPGYSFGTVSGGTYVAYLFAHDAGGFGLSGTDNVISCGSFTTDGSGNATVNLGYEPQWILTKTATVINDWELQDAMRGLSYSNNGHLQPNTSAVENTGYVGYTATATGFNAVTRVTSATYIYIAIRRGPMKVPTSGTSVYNAIARTGTGAVATVTGVGFSPDLVIGKTRTQSYLVADGFVDRLRGVDIELTSASVASELNNSTPSNYNSVHILNMDGFTLGADDYTGRFNTSTFTYINWNFKRAPGFFDVVCYTGTGVARTVNHNLGAVPEMMIVKDRAGAGAGNDWAVYVSSVGPTGYLTLNANLEARTVAGGYTKNPWNSTTPTSTVFSVKTDSSVNFNGFTYVAYLFATCAGVSKVGSYTGNGSSQTINCGFTGGARFVLIKRTDSTGDWYVWDTARGIVAGNDPHLSLNSTAAEVTTNDSIDTDSTGFIVNQLAATNINVSSATYIFLAIA